MRGIYEIRNTVTEHTYIGQAQSIEQRWKNHRERLAAGMHHNYPLQEAWVRDGEDAFVFTVLEEVPYPGNLDTAEARAITAMRPYYNIAPPIKPFVAKERKAQLGDIFIEHPFDLFTGNTLDRLLTGLATPGTGVRGALGEHCPRCGAGLCFVVEESGVHLRIQGSREE